MVYYGVVVTWRIGGERYKKHFSGPEKADKFFGSLAWKKAGGAPIRKLRIKPVFR